MSARVRAAAGGLVALAALAAAAVVLLVSLTGADAPEGDVQTFEARAALSPAKHLFGDPVTAEVTVAYNRLAIDGNSVRVRTRFEPYLVVGRSQRVTTEGRSAVAHYRYRLLCTDAACLSPLRTRRFAFPPPEVQFTPTDGTARTATLRWTPLESTSRLRPSHLQQPTLGPLFRIRLAPPEPSYRLDPALATGLLYGAAALLAALALSVLRPELARAAALLPRRGRDPLAGLPPLERALVLVERAGSNGRDPRELRTALDRLARELRRTGANELAASARRLAWSPPPPGDPALGTLTGNVRRTIGARS